MSSILHQNIRRICRPLLVHPVIGHQGFRLRPDAGAVVQFHQMGQLVGNHAVDQWRVVLDQPPVRPEAAVAAARALRSNIFPWR